MFGLPADALTQAVPRANNLLAAPSTDAVQQAYVHVPGRGVPLSLVGVFRRTVDDAMATRCIRVLFIQCKA
jgi:hypothetical protein